MFSNLLFIILVLILINFIVEVPLQPLIESPSLGFSLSLLLYGAALVLIYVQNKLFRKKLTLLVNLELLLFLTLFIFVFGGHRIFEWPSQALMSLVALSFYLFGLWFFHYTNARTKSYVESPCAEANLELRLIVPFTLPFLFFTLLVDLFSLSPTIEIQNEWVASLVILLVSLFFLVLMMVFFPPVLQWLWQCRPLPRNELTERLEALCQKAKFKHAGMRTWSIMAKASTAAIIGVVPKFRYVMFTEGLLKNLSAESVEAVLAHEIGHSYHKHLILYPFIIFGMLFSVSLFSYFLEEPLNLYLVQQNLTTLIPFVIFVVYALIIALYFRIVFGFFSRQFERQADLHVFKLNMPPETMKEALLEVARGMGVSPKTPSWHHYSIQERVDFLDKATANRSLISKHHLKVKIYFTLYLILLGFVILYLFMV